MITATSRMSSTVNSTLSQGAIICVTASPELRTFTCLQPYILKQRTGTLFLPEPLVFFGIEDVVNPCPNFPIGHPRRNILTRVHLRSVLHQIPLCIEHQSVPALQDGQRGKHLQRTVHAVGPHFVLQQQIPHGGG